MVYLRLSRPTKKIVDSCVDESVRQGHNYDHVGATRTALPLAPQVKPRTPGLPYFVDHNRIVIGNGKADYAAAKECMSRWGHFDLGWATVDPATPIKPGSPVCVVASSLAVFWTMNPLQIVYVENDPASGPAGRPKRAARFAFAHGTLGGHMLAGEERFALELDAKDGSVWYEVLAFSRPAHPLSVLMLPLARWQQQQFGKQSCELVRRAVKGGGGGGGGGGGSSGGKKK